jgi:hypothetical protein
MTARNSAAKHLPDTDLRWDDILEEPSTTYLVDNMFNGLAKELSKAGIDCDTVIHAIWRDDNSAQKDRSDAKIFRFLLEKKFTLIPHADISEDYTIITADKDLERYCREFGIGCHFVPQPRPLTGPEYKALAVELAGELGKKKQQKEGP